MKNIANNKKAYFDYEIIEEIESGIKLLGPEVKSLRLGRCNLKGSFCKYFKGELFVFGIHISKLDNIDKFSTISETRERKLLMTKRQLDKWFDRLDKEQHLTIVPLSIYFNDNNKIKIRIGLAKGKKLYDKRDTDKLNSINMNKIRKDVELYK